MDKVFTGLGLRRVLNTEKQIAFKKYYYDFRTVERKIIHINALNLNLLSLYPTSTQSLSVTIPRLIKRVKILTGFAEYHNNINLNII